MKKLLILVVLLLVSIPGFAETVDTAWVRRYNGAGNSTDYAHAISVDASNNVYVTGKSGDDYATIKYYFNGDTAWVRRYNGPGNDNDEAWAITVDSYCNVYVTGESWGGGAHLDYATIKYYSNGDTVWVRRYNGPGNLQDVATAIAVDSHCNVYVTGESHGSQTPYDMDYATIKYYPDGDTAWVRRYDSGPGENTDWPYAIAVDSSGNVYVTGASYGSGTHYDYATIKYYLNGSIAWTKRYNGQGNSDDYAYSIVVDTSGNVYVTGESYGSGTSSDYATIKYYPNGDTAWIRRYDGSAKLVDEAHAIAVDSYGNVYVTGSSAGSGTGEDYTTIKYLPNGDTAWVRRYNGPANSDDGANGIAVDGIGNVYVTGSSTGSGTGTDYATVKYLPNGDTAWVMRYNGAGNGVDYAYPIAIDDSGNVYVTGWSHGGSGTSYDYCTIKYVKKGSGVKDETGSKEKPSEFGLSQNYPNPFNPTTKIEFTLAKSGYVTLQIYDVLGRKVRTLVSEQLSSGYKSVIWDGKNDDGKDVASGVYFYRLKAGGFSETKKMVIIK
jgi:hypothetical protein